MGQLQVQQRRKGGLIRGFPITVGTHAFAKSSLGIAGRFRVKLLGLGVGETPLAIQGFGSGEKLGFKFPLRQDDGNRAMRRHALRPL